LRRSKTAAEWTRLGRTASTGKVGSFTVEIVKQVASDFALRAIRGQITE
jgi:hypothetical protein